MPRTAQVLVTVPNIIRSQDGAMIRKRGHDVIELELVLPSSAVTKGQLRSFTEAEIELFNLQHSCIQADVYHAGSCIASFIPVRS